MRNLFDQYNQPENRLTHALAVCLHEDRRLLRQFLTWIGTKSPVRSVELMIAEQTLPGTRPESEEQAERKGLPDIVIHDAAGWCLLIESKVQAALIDDQLARHERTPRRRGFEYVRCVVLTKNNARNARQIIALTWSGLYEWLGKNSIRSEWSERLRSYLRDAEVRLAREDYLTEGTLTMFDGFQFSVDNPYTYGEGKRLLKLAMADLRKDGLLKRLGMDPSVPGRGAITGRGQRGVWDFLSLADRSKNGSFTSYAHLTLGVSADYLEVVITIPNDVAPKVRKRLTELNAEGWIKLNNQIMRRARRIISLGASVQAYAVQRHFPSQRSPTITDARMDFKLQTCQSGGDGTVKQQPQWVKLFAELLHNSEQTSSSAMLCDCRGGPKGWTAGNRCG